ncbi:putative gene 9495 [Cricetulus griseus]
MEEDFEYDALTLQAPRRVRWYNRLWPACLRCGCLSCKRQEFPLYFVGYDPMGQFQRAASVGDVASVERFINFHGCHVNEVDRRGRTPLHYACAHNHPDVVRLLLSHKANIDILDDEGCTPLIKVAIGQQFWNVYLDVLELKISFFTQYLQAAQRDNVECVSILLTQDADPHLMDLSGHTALHHAVCRGKTEIVSKLLEYNVDIEGKTESNTTCASKINTQEICPAHYRVVIIQILLLVLEVHDYIVDPMPLRRLSEETDSSESSSEDEDSLSIIKDFIENLSASNTSSACRFDTLKHGEHEGRKNSHKSLGPLIHTSHPCIPEGEVAEKKAEPSTIPADPGIAEPQPTAHIGSTSSLGTGDRGEIVEAPKNKDLGAVRNTALDLKLPLVAAAEDD